MKTTLKTGIYLLLAPIFLWLAFITVSFLISFSYGDNLSSKFIYFIIGNWVPGKLYGLTLFHSIICIITTIVIIGFLDKLLLLKPNARLTILILVSFFFFYEAFFNFFMQKNQESLAPQFKQIALLQVSFVIGIIIKALDFDSN